MLTVSPEFTAAQSPPELSPDWPAALARASRRPQWPSPALPTAVLFTWIVTEAADRGRSSGLAKARHKINVARMGAPG
jgi:hypothetical protein